MPTCQSKLTAPASVGAKSAKLRLRRQPKAAAVNCVRSLAPPFKTATALPGCGFVFGPSAHILSTFYIERTFVEFVAVYFHNLTNTGDAKQHMPSLPKKATYFLEGGIRYG